MSFTLTYHGKSANFEKPLTLSSLVPEAERYQYLACKVNNRVRELSYEIDYDADLEFLTIKNSDAVKTYETSLRYLVAMAFRNINPELKIRFSYNVSRSIFVQLLGAKMHADGSLVKKLFDEMKRLVSSDLPFVRRKVSIEEIREIYQREGEIDKLDLLKYRPEKTAHLYECGGYYNYMYGRMVPSTGYLKDWELRLYAPGIIVQYPRAEADGKIPPFEDAPTFGKTLKESHRWGQISGADTVYSLNRMVKEDGEIDFINICETYHNRQLCELGKIISEDISDIRLICIAGPSSSGKTTFSNRLRIELLSRGIKPIRLSIDDYYLPRNQAPKDEYGDPDLESIYALDIDLFNQNMADLIAGSEVQLPKFDFKIGQRVPGRILKVPTDQPIIIEGIHALNDQLTHLIPKHQKFKIYIAPQPQMNYDLQNPISLTDLRLLRRIVRDFKYRNASAIETMKMWPSVRKGEFKWIYGTQEGADYVYNSFLSYELCVMKKYALPLLQDIHESSEFFPVAERLIRMLKYFVDINDTWVPCNSLLREFIGGSAFADMD